MWKDKLQPKNDWRLNVVINVTVWMFVVVTPLAYFSVPEWRNRETEALAQTYFEEQRHAISLSRAKLELHPYFELPSLHGSDESESIRWIGMISRRLARWAREQEQLPPGVVGHHKVEKDKCECQSFLSELGVGVVPIVGEWRPENWNADEFKQLIETTPFPIIVKLGHIQQSIGLKIFNDREMMLKDMKHVVEWIEKGFVDRFDDGTRKWAIDANVLYDALKPCLLVHPLLGKEWLSTPILWEKASRPTKPIELKVEVLWGHAYLAFIETREFRRTFFGMFPIEPQSSLVVLRDGRTTRFVEWPKRFEWEWFWPWDQTWQYLANTPHTNVAGDPILTEYSWLTMHFLQPVLDTAEKVAKGLGADQVRVDIFVNPQDAANPVVNEISLSSGHYYRYHIEQMTSVWAEGHRLQDYKKKQL